MNGSEIIRICRDLINQTGPLTPLAEDSPTLHTALKIFEQMFKGEINTPQQASLLAYELGMELINDISSINGEQSSEPNIIDKVTRYCLEHLDEPIGVEEMSQAAGYSRFHFSRLFHKYQGDSPASFLRELRLQKALQLLQTDRLKIKAIAERCGFQSASYFARAFQKKFGCYPRAFKESAKK
jgi:AraC-like DNA-binding protein